MRDCGCFALAFATVAVRLYDRGVFYEFGTVARTCTSALSFGSRQSAPSSCCPPQSLYSLLDADAFVSRRTVSEDLNFYTFPFVSSAGFFPAGRRFRGYDPDLSGGKKKNEV